MVETLRIYMYSGPNFRGSRHFLLIFLSIFLNAELASQVFFVDSIYLTGKNDMATESLMSSL